MRSALAAAVLLAGSLPAYAATETASRDLARIPFNLAVLFVVALVLIGIGNKAMLMGRARRARAARRVKLIFGMPLCWLVLSLVHAETGWPKSGWVAWSLFLVTVVLMFAFGQHLVPGALRRFFPSMYPDDAPDTHGSAHFGTAVIGARHLAPAAPADAFVLGYMRGVSRKGDPRFRQDGHVLTCAPTGAGKGIGAVIPNLLAYPGSAFVLDLKGENYAVTARARRELGQHVVLVDPFGITGQATHALDWLDTLDPDSPDVVSRAAGLADMLIAVEGAEADSHWTDTARELLRGLLVYAATLPADRRTMAELRRIVTALRRRSRGHPGGHGGRSRMRPAHSGARGGGTPQPAGAGARLGAVHSRAAHRVAGRSAAVRRPRPLGLRHGRSQAPADDGLSGDPAGPAAGLPGLRAGVHRPGAGRPHGSPWEARTPGGVPPR